MKAAAFELAQPETVDEAISLLANDGARVLAGGQSLGPMLNLRLVRPRLLVRVNRLAELAGVTVDADAVTIGACVTHASIEDGAVPDIGADVMARVAGGIAYRAVRNCGTIGGSLCHADPAADWVTVLIALGASVLLRGPNGPRTLPVDDFILGAYRTAIEPGEILCAIRVPRFAADARWGFVKACRKPGDFAHAMAAVLLSVGTRRAVIGASGGKPLALAPEDATLSLQTSDHLDDVRRHMQHVTLHRALATAGA